MIQVYDGDGIKPNTFWILRCDDLRPTVAADARVHWLLHFRVDTMFADWTKHRRNAKRFESRAEAEEMSRMWSSNSAQQVFTIEVDSD